MLHFPECANKRLRTLEHEFRTVQIPMKETHECNLLVFLCKNAEAIFYFISGTVKLPNFRHRFHGMCWALCGSDPHASHSVMSCLALHRVRRSQGFVFARRTVWRNMQLFCFVIYCYFLKFLCWNRVCVCVCANYGLDIFIAAHLSCGKIQI